MSRYKLINTFAAIVFLGVFSIATAANQVMTWVPPYAIEQSQAAATADFGLCDAKDGLTRVGLQFWTPNPDGTIKYADHEWYTPTDTNVGWWRNWCADNGIQCLLTIYNNTGTWNWDLARSAFADNRTTFVNALIGEMDRLGLDGIDVDLEGIGNLDGDRSAFDQFIHDLWVQLDQRGKLLTINSFHYIWNAPNHNWWSDWLGEADTIQSMGYDDLFEGGSDWHKYSYQQNAGVTAGYSGNSVLMGMPAWLDSWGTSSGRGTSALAHVQEVRYDLPHDSTGIAIWDLQLSAWQNSDLWCEVAALKEEGSLQFAAIGDFGSGSGNEAAVADLVTGWNPDLIITAGDNRYGSTSFDQVVGQFYCDYLADAGSGSFCAGGNSLTNDFFPSPGNHDYNDGGGLNEYLDYFTLPGPGTVSSDTSGSERFYDFVQGPVHFFAIDSQGVSNSAADELVQRNWLRQGLAASTAPWQVVFFHHAPYSSASHGNTMVMQWPFATWGADAVITGQDHSYERVSWNGIPYFVNGLGGMSIYGFNTPIIGSQVRYNGDYGAMRITASNASLNFQFLDAAGMLIDDHTVEQGGPRVLDVSISSANDDVEQKLSDGSMYFNSSDLELGEDSDLDGDQTVGLRFQNVAIPQGATIQAATLMFKTDGISSETTSLLIRAEAIDDAGAFSNTEYNLTDRPVTVADVPWDVPGWAVDGQTHQSPDLSSLVQELVDRPGWNTDNSMVFIVEGTGMRRVESYDGNADLAPVLHIEFTDGPAPNSPPSPNPMTWAQIPYMNPAWPEYNVATMAASTATDPDGGVEYYLDCVEAPQGGYWEGCEDSGWQSGTTFSDWYLIAGNTYHYQVKARDALGNETGWSNQAQITVPTANLAPTASFTSSCTNLACSFNDTSTDNDGTIASRSWDFGDGSGATTANPSHTYAAAGTYTVALSVTDNEDATGSTSQNISVATATPLVVHVGDLDVTKSGNKRWTAYVTVSTHDSNDANVSGVTVSGSWSDGTAGSCVTNQGTCTVSRGTKADSLGFSVSNISGGNAEYDASANHDPDGDSNGTSIAINKDGTILGGNSPPVALDDAVSIHTGETAVIQVLDNDTDADGDVLDIVTVQNASHGEATTDGTTISYTPQVEFTGTDSFSYTVTDGQATDSALVKVTVSEPQPAVVVHVGTMTGSAVNGKGPFWNATVTTGVHDSAHELIPGVTVSGNWSGSISGSASCITDTTGSCDVSKRIKGGSDATFSISSLSGTGVEHQSGNDHVSWFSLVKP